MNPAIIFIYLSLFIGNPWSDELKVIHERSLDFTIDKLGLFEDHIQMFYSLLDEDHELVDCKNNNSISFSNQILPLDIYQVYENKDEDEYYSLLTKTVYGLPQDISFFTSERLCDVQYLQAVMPSNKIKKVNDHYELEVGFSAPDIDFRIDFFTNDELNEQFPDLINYFEKYDQYDANPTMTAVQHNYRYSKIMGQKTSKMSVSITRYFDEGKNGTLVINYTLNYIHNIPPGIVGGANMMVNQMEKGMHALVKDTRNMNLNSIK